MALYRKGIMGPFSGKLGTVVGANWLGIEYMRSVPERSGKPSSLKQLIQQSKMGMFRAFLLGVNQFVVNGFQNLGDKKTPMNAALSYNMLWAVNGVYPNDSVNFNELLITKGDLFGASSPEASSTETCALDFTWLNRNFTHLSAADDVAIMIVYCETREEFVYLENAGLREDGQSRLLLNKKFIGHKLHCYLIFMSADRKTFSTNAYLGEVSVV